MATKHFVNARKIYYYTSDDVKYANETKDLQAYIKSKIKMLEEDFKIRLTYKEKTDLEELTDARAVDRAVRRIIINKL